ncbi:hypothetical protein FCN18_09190 [Prauserella endophytica]|uniref:Uncharacterized protein n=1 Tax=Prauserella endophytica TaxID=1592324 RepID=A0ABY2S6Z7_9PSEU|nr:hypothetical protein FCN18_09190 [Prauserella endophytica]
MDEFTARRKRPADLALHPDPRAFRNVGLTLQHTNQTILVEGPEITIRPVGTRCLSAGGAR